MKKQLFLFVVVSLISTQIDASAAQRKAQLRAEIAKGPVGVVSGRGSGSGGGNQFGSAGATQAQMESAVAQDLPGSMAAVQKAQSNIGVEPSNTPNQTVYNYIMGQ
ncbi:hypothetical protein KBB68_01395 [Candidatus Babeliales bacterium]|nr:hypothetical protein [Candidatus Babeliales bacterium]